MLFGVSNKYKIVEKMNLLHFLVSTLKNFLILDTDSMSVVYTFVVIRRDYKYR